MNAPDGMMRPETVLMGIKISEMDVFSGQE